MEEKYKLQEIQNDNIFTSKKVKYLLFIIWLIGVILLSVLIFLISKFIGISLLIAFIYSFIFGMIALYICLIPKNNKEYKYIKDIGKKDTAYIVDTGFTHYSHSGHSGGNPIVSIAIVAAFSYSAIKRHGHIKNENSSRNLYYITIVYKEKVKNIYNLQDNNAYEILKLILDTHTYPVAKPINIPVDVYVYGNKLYVDFESVKLSTLEGYEEAKNVIEKLNEQ